MYLQALEAATYYVAPGGSDANIGTVTQPWASISRAVSIAAPGDAIILRDGVYGPEGSPTGFSVSINRAGTPNSWIVLKAEHKWGAILDCQPPGVLSPACNGYFYLDSGAAYWVIQDLVVQNGLNFGISANSTPAAHDILIQGCRFQYIGRRSNSSVYGEAGVYVGPGSTNFTFDSNVLHDIGRTAGVHLFNDHGLYLHSSGTTIVNNIFYAPISGWAVQTSEGFSGMIANNTFALPMQNNGGHIMLWQTNSAVTIRNNIFYKPAGGIAVNHSGLIISDGCSVDHNVITGAVAGSPPGCSVSSNVEADAGMVNARTGPYDFHLLTGSPAIDEGVPMPSITVDFDGVSRPQGTAPCAGAFEYSSAAAKGFAPPRAAKAAAKSAN
jgi:hypothetical protein